MTPAQLVQFVIAAGRGHHPPVTLVEGEPQKSDARTIWVAGYVGRPHQKVATVPPHGGQIEVYYNPAYCAAARGAAHNANMPCTLHHNDKQLRVSNIPQAPAGPQLAALTAVVNASINANPHV